MMCVTPTNMNVYGVADVARRRGFRFREARCGAERRPGTCTGLDGFTLDQTKQASASFRVGFGWDPPADTEITLPNRAK
jgi:hypothetical protein